MHMSMEPGYESGDDLALFAVGPESGQHLDPNWKGL